ncbi:MAG: exopolyphosphatase/guanosine-5'-triphosphate,3'-diphosphate pyrophosphatase [Crocinitomix sp.]
MKRIAIIDLGTNTFNLLVIDKLANGFKEVFSTKVGVGLGLGGINENRIHADAEKRALETLSAYKQKANELNVDQIVAYGTSAIRNASNKTDFIQLVKSQVGIAIEVISGKREAELIYKGVTIGLETTEPFIVMDIGGGSTEFIYGTVAELLTAGSFEIGASRIYQGFDFTDPYTLENCEVIEAYLEKGVGSFFDTIQTEQLIGASGSFETFYELLSDKTYPANEYVVLPKAELMAQLERIIYSTKAEREKDDRIIPIRKKMAPIAAVKIRWIIRKLNIQKITISPFSLKEGVIDEVKV